MRTKHSQQRRQLENAFSFGQSKQESYMQSPIRNRNIHKNIKYYDKDQQNRDYSAKTIKHEREGLKNTNNQYDFKQKPMGIKFNVLNYGKSIDSQPIEDSMEIISRVFREEGLKIQQITHNKIEVDNDRFYNPSIQKIKNKYGLNNSKSIITKSNSFLKPISLHHIDMQVYDKQQAFSKSPSKPSYKCENNSRIYYGINQNEKKYMLNSSFSRTSNRFHHFQNKSKIKQNSSYEYQKSRSKNKILTQNNLLVSSHSHNLFINNYNRPLSPSFAYQKSSNNNSKILKSIHDLDSKINQKLNRIIPSNYY